MTVQQVFDFFAQPETAADAAAGESICAGAARASSARVGSAHSLSLIDQLRAQVESIHAPAADGDTATRSTGSPAIDTLLPRGGLRSNAVTEWVAAADGSGAAALAMIAAATGLQQSSGPLVVVCRPDQFYPPAAVALGIPPGRVVWVRPDRPADTVWAIDQALRSTATAAVWAPVDARLDDRDARRFQLAAETGNTPGLFIRPATVRGRPTFADIRFHVDNEFPVGHPGDQLAKHPAGQSTRLLRVTVERCRGGQIGRSVAVRINDDATIEQVTLAPRRRHRDEAVPMHLASQLARAQPQRSRRQRRA